MSSLYKRTDSKYYWWTTRYKGKKVYKSTKMTQIHLAKKVKVQFDLDIALGKADFLGISKHSPMNVTNYTRQYLAFVDKRKSINTYEIARGVLNKFHDFLQSIEIKRMDEISVKVINNYIDWLKNAPKTIKNYHGIVSLMLKQAVKENVLQSNPAELATLPKIIHNPNKHRMLLPIDLQIIFETAGKWFEFYQFLLHTGFRAGDVAMLTYGNIDRQKRAITSLIHKPSRVHEMPLSDHLINGLQFGKNEEPLFPCLYTENKKQRNNRLAAPRKHLQSMLRINGRPKATLPSFRKTFNNILRDLGLDIGDRQKLMAHSSSETTKIYTIPNFDRAKEFVDKIPVYGMPEKAKRNQNVTKNVTK